MARKDVSDGLVCEAYGQSVFGNVEGKGLSPLEYLVAKTGEPEKVCFRAMERACDNGLVDFGVTLVSGWLTMKGKDALAAHLSSGVSSDHDLISINAGLGALEAHSERLGIEGDAETRVWHLLLSLKEYCASNDIDMAKVMGEVDAAVASGEVHAPATEAFEQRKRMRDTVLSVYPSTSSCGRNKP